ncbi:MAG: cation transporter [Rhodobacteraceae bacterium]|nr:cation transporter [Paracoccaceae bacterium]
MDLRIKAACGSIAIGIAVFSLKYMAYDLTGSTALFSDALETTVNVVSSIATLIAIWFATKPADENHQYGHDKAEYFATVFIGILISLAAFSIFQAAWNGYVREQDFSYSPLGLGLNALASVLNAIWATVLIKVGKKERSPSLKADGHHLLADIATSLGVLLGVGLVVLTGWRILDPLLAALVGIGVLWTGGQIVKDSIAGLMDEAVSTEIQDEIHDLIRQHGEGAIEAHDVRTRLAGSSIFVEFHLVVPGKMPVDEAHVICDRLEAIIHEEVPGSKVTIHIEPDHKTEPNAIVVPD